MHCSSKPVAAVPTVRLTSALVGDPRVRDAIASRLGVGKSGRFAAMMTSGFRFSASRRGPGPRSSGARTSIPAAFLGGSSGTALVVGLRCSFGGKDAGSVNSRKLLARL